MAPARYFPVRPQALKMAPGLSALRRDFGNGSRDALHFPRDRQWPHYLEAKRAIWDSTPDRLQVESSVETGEIHQAVREWMASRIAMECDLVGICGVAEPPSYQELTAAIQEDFAVINVPNGGQDRVVGFSVSFPSGWRPEKLRGQSFLSVHAPVPEFGIRPSAVPSLLRRIVEHGPHVRFVWTVSADERLDHHPDSQYQRASDHGQGWLRVERQVRFRRIRLVYF